MASAVKAKIVATMMPLPDFIRASVCVWRMMPTASGTVPSPKPARSWPTMSIGIETDSAEINVPAPTIERTARSTFRLS